MTPATVTTWLNTHANPVRRGMMAMVAALSLAVVALGAVPEFHADYENGGIDAAVAGSARGASKQILEGAGYESPPRGAVVEAPTPLPGRAGHRAVRFHLAVDDPQLHSGHRAELRLKGNDAIGGTYWYVFSIHVPSQALFKPAPGCDVVSESGVIFAQWHHADTPNAAGMSPMIAVEVHQRAENGTVGAPYWSLALREFYEAGVAAPVDRARGPLKRQKDRVFFSRTRPRPDEPAFPVRCDGWTDFVVQVRWSTEGKGERAGFVRCWIVDEAHPDGRLFEETNFKTYPADIPAGPYMKWGIYKYIWKAPPPSHGQGYGHLPACRTPHTVYHDEIAAYRDDAGTLTWRDVAPKR